MYVSLRYDGFGLCCSKQGTFVIFLLLFTPFCGDLSGLVVPCVLFILLHKRVLTISLLSFGCIYLGHLQVSQPSVGCQNLQHFMVLNLNHVNGYVSLTFCMCLSSTCTSKKKIVHLYHLQPFKKFQATNQINPFPSLELCTRKIQRLQQARKKP